AGEYYGEIAGIAEQLVDYYVEITDNEGNLAKTAIQHVYVGPSNTGGGSGQSGVFWTPANPTSNDIITITQTDVGVGAKLHWGVNTGNQAWQTPNAAYWPAGSSLFSPTGSAIESPMNGPDGEGNITIQIGPFNNPAQELDMVDFVFHYNNNTWNNNNGADFHISINNVPVGGFLLSARNITQTAPNVLEFDVYLLNENAAEPFELATIQMGITFNASILNGAAQTSGMTSIVAGSSQLPANMEPISVNTALPGLIRVAGRAAPGTGNGYILSTVSPGTRIVRLRMTNAVPFTSVSTPDMSFTSSTTTQPSYPTRVAHYEDNTNIQLVVTPGSNANIEENPVLNGPPSLVVTPAIQSVTPEAGVCDYVINSNASWSAASNQSWCTLSPMAGFGSGIITAQYAENTATARSADISVNVTGLPEMTVILNQEDSPYKVLHLNALLEGLYDGNGTMKQAHDENGPVFAAGIADVIDVEFHNASEYSITEYTASGVQLSTSGDAVVNVPAFLNGSYYLTVKHRNSVRITTANPVSFPGTEITYTFDQPAKAFGGNLLLMADGYYLIYSGDVNQDGFVDTGDTTPIDNDQFYFVSGYVVTDINGDGTVDTADGTFVDNNQFFFIGSILP
ncbi:MAG: BACON domain-containing protein, partial [Bacteroidota bacterium]